MRALPVLFLSLLLVFSGCKDDSVLPAEVFDHDWYNTFEKDKQEFYLFTPTPRATGWQYDGFRLNKDGTFLEYGLGPADAPETRPGTWEAKGKQAYQITFEDAQRKGYTLYLQAVSTEELNARRAY